MEPSKGISTRIGNYYTDRSSIFYLGVSPLLACGRGWSWLRSNLNSKSTAVNVSVGIAEILPAILLLALTVVSFVLALITFILKPFLSPPCCSDSAKPDTPPPKPRRVVVRVDKDSKAPRPGVYKPPSTQRPPPLVSNYVRASIPPLKPPSLPKRPSPAASKKESPPPRFAEKASIYEFVIRGENGGEYIEVPGNGNCCFSSILAAKKRLQAGNDLRDTNGLLRQSALARRNAVAWMEANREDETFNIFLKEGIGSFIGHKMADVAEQTQSLESECASLELGKTVISSKKLKSLEAEIEGVRKQLSELIATSAYLVNLLDILSQDDLVPDEVYSYYITFMKHEPNQTDSRIEYAGIPEAYAMAAQNPDIEVDILDTQRARYPTLAQHLPLNQGAQYKMSLHYTDNHFNAILPPPPGLGLV